MAKTWEVPLDDWQLTGRSLLNRDALGNYKFAHRSIMEYLIVKRFADGDPACRNLQWSDQMQRFLWEIIRNYQEKRESVPFDLAGADLSLYQLKLRKTPEKSVLEHDAVGEMLKRHNFFDKNRNKNSKGIEHLYQKISKVKANVVIDYKTSLMWQQSGSSNMTYEGAKKYIEQLNREQFAGYSDWRLPTLEEAMSLMEPKKNKDGLYIDAVFDKTQRWIWTADSYSASAAWVVDFYGGGCRYYHVGYADDVVRAVRFGH